MVKTEKNRDLHGRYVAHLFYTSEDVALTTCFEQGTYLNEELLQEGHAVRVG